MSPELEEARFAVHDDPVRIRIPARIGNDLDALQQTIAELADRLGCPRCFSGADCRFQREKDFVVDPEGRLGPVPDPWRSLPSDPVPLRTARAVQVSLPLQVSNDLEGVQNAIGNVLGKLGCMACCSGFDIEFRNELDLIRVDEKLDVQGFGRFA
jgi:hypothetical protein